MKKILFAIFLVAACSTAAFAQNSSFHNGTKLGGISLGLGGLDGTNFGLSYEQGVYDNLFGVSGLNLGVGAQFGYYGTSKKNSIDGMSYTVSANAFIIAVRGAMHYEFVSKLDTYLGLNLGAIVASAYSKADGHGVDIKSEGDTSTEFGYGLCIGTRYFITNGFALGLEFGGGTTTSTAALTLTFKF